MKGDGMDIFVILLFTIAALIFSFKTTKVKDLKGKIRIFCMTSIVLIIGLFRFDYITSKLSMLLMILEFIMLVIVDYILMKNKK
jgi:hypothetical protein